jgi:hypothetical protein
LNHLLGAAHNQCICEGLARTIEWRGSRRCPQNRIATLHRQQDCMLSKARIVLVNQQEDAHNASVCLLVPACVCFWPNPHEYAQRLPVSPAPPPLTSQLRRRHADAALSFANTHQQPHSYLVQCSRASVCAQEPWGQCSARPLNLRSLLWNRRSRSEETVVRGKPPYLSKVVGLEPCLTPRARATAHHVIRPPFEHFEGKAQPWTPPQRPSPPYVYF